MAPQDGLEPPAYRLTAGCSTIELLRNDGKVVCLIASSKAVQAIAYRVDMRSCTFKTGYASKIKQGMCG